MKADAYHAQSHTARRVRLSLLRAAIGCGAIEGSHWCSRRGQAGRVVVDASAVQIGGTFWQDGSGRHAAAAARGVRGSSQAALHAAGADDGPGQRCAGVVGRSKEGSAAAWYSREGWTAIAG